MRTPEQIAEDAVREYISAPFSPEEMTPRQLIVGLGLSEGQAESILEMITDAIWTDRAQRKTKKVHIVFDGPPAHESGRFIETETPDGKGVSLGDWMRRPDGYWVLEIEVPA